MKIFKYLCFFGVLVLFVILFVPNASQVAPGVKLTLLDDKNMPLQNVEGFYSFTRYPTTESASIDFELNKKGTVILERQVMKSNLFANLKEIFSFLILHAGNSIPFATITLYISKEYMFDNYSNDVTFIEELKMKTSLSSQNFFQYKDKKNNDVTFIVYDDEQLNQLTVYLREPTIRDNLEFKFYLRCTKNGTKN